MAVVLAVICVAGVYAAQHSAKGESLAADELLHRTVEIPLVFAEGLVTSSTEWVAEIFQREELHEEVRGLETEVARLTMRLAELEDARRENQRLEELLALRARHGVTGRAARVIAAESSAALRSVLINAGAEDGVEKDSAVIAPAGLVGRVLKVGARTSVVQLIVDATSGVGVIDDRSRVQGVLVGTGTSDLGIRYVPNFEDIQPGDRIVASGLDGIYPKGVTVGVVAEVSPGRDAFKVIHIRPAVAFTRLETVLVISPGEREAAARADLGTVAAGAGS